jgi:hypothetical protein
MTDLFPQVGHLSFASWATLLRKLVNSISQVGQLATSSWATLDIKLGKLQR